MTLRDASWGLPLVLVLGACGSSGTAGNTLVPRQAAPIHSAQSNADHSRCDATRPGRTATEYDTNGDGVPDVRKVYQTAGEGGDVHSVLVCREVDLNHDGIKDVFRFYNDEGRTLREEEDRDFDGRIDVITYFENGDIVRQEFDTNHDGMVDMRLYFRDHRPYRAERELQHDSSTDFHPDYWEFYDARGHVVRIGWDLNHDGRADRWDRVDRITPLRMAPSLGASTAQPGAPAVGAPAVGAPTRAAPGTPSAGTPPPGAAATGSPGAGAPAAPAQPAPPTAH